MQKTLTMTILAIDDDDDDLEFFKDVIFSIDPNLGCILTQNCNDAYLILHETIPDVLFLDINMPKVDGIECYKHLMQNEDLKNIPIVFCTTAVNPGNTARLLSDTVKFITKQPTFERAKASIMEVLNDLHLLTLT